MDKFNILLEVISENFGLTAEELVIKTRKRDIVELRYACVNILLKHSTLDQDEIVNLLNLERTTGYNAIKVNDNSKSTNSNSSYQEKYDKLEEEFIKKMHTPERIIAKIKKLKKERKSLDENIHQLECMLEEKLNSIEL